MDLTTELKGDYATYCDLRAQAARREADRQVATYGGDSGPGSSANAQKTAWQVRATIEAAARRADAWQARARAARRGVFLLQKADSSDAEFFSSEIVRKYKDASLSKGMIEYEEWAWA